MRRIVAKTITLLFFFVLFFATSAQAAQHKIDKQQAKRLINEAIHKYYHSPSEVLYLSPYRVEIVLHYPLTNEERRIFGSLDNYHRDGKIHVYSEKITEYVLEHNWEFNHAIVWYKRKKILDVGMVLVRKKLGDKIFESRYTGKIICGHPDTDSIMYGEEITMNCVTLRFELHPVFAEKAIHEGSDLRAGTRRVIDVIKIDNNAIWFTFRYMPNIVGKYMGLWPERKLRGKAEYSYDIFTKEYSIEDVSAAAWRGGSWDNVDAHHLYDISLYGAGVIICGKQFGEAIRDGHKKILMYAVTSPDGCVWGTGSSFGEAARECNERRTETDGPCTVFSYDGHLKTWR